MVKAILYYRTFDYFLGCSSDYNHHYGFLAKETPQGFQLLSTFGCKVAMISDSLQRCVSHAGGKDYRSPILNFEAELGRFECYRPQFQCLDSHHLNLANFAEIATS